MPRSLEEVRVRIGIDLGGTKTEGVLLDAAGATLRRERIATPREGGYQSILDAVVGHVEMLAAQASSPCTVGVGIPGTVDTRTGVVKNANTTALIGHPLAADLAQRLGQPVAVANDANCFAVAEARAGAARDAAVVFGVILGTGVGGGVVWNGRAWSGHQGIAGEWGHSRLADPDDVPAPRCYCGHRGCIETRLSGPALEGDYLRLSGGMVRVAAADLPARANAGDDAAAEALARYLWFFGEAMASVLHVLDPEVVVLGGGLSNLEMLYTDGPAAIEARLFNPRLETPIRKAALGDSAGVFGAAWLPAEAR
jgi:fructokinase